MMLATPAEVPKAKRTGPSECQTSPKTRINPKGLFPAVANRAGRPTGARDCRGNRDWVGRAGRAPSVQPFETGHLAKHQQYWAAIVSVSFLKQRFDPVAPAMKFVHWVCEEMDQGFAGYSI
jgi:hypothetical protein